MKDYCCRTWGRILENKVSIQDFIFAKEVKMGTYRCVPQLAYHSTSLSPIICLL